MKIRSLDKTKDVWAVHAQKSPSCQYVIQRKGVQYVRQILAEFGSYQKPEKTARLAVCNTVRSTSKIRFQCYIWILKEKYTKTDMHAKKIIRSD